MRSKFLHLLVLCIYSASANLYAQGNQASDREIPGEEIVLQWNRVLTQTLAISGQHPTTVRIQRSYAVMHLAMFDAINSVDGNFTPYLTKVPSAGASSRAAAAFAAHGVLSSLYPSRVAVFDAELADSLIGVPNNGAVAGRQIGILCAQRMLANRANDGWTVTPPPYILPTTPGNWQPTPPGNAAAVLSVHSSPWRRQVRPRLRQSAAQRAEWRLCPCQTSRCRR